MALLAILIGPFFTVPDYSSIEHTTSELGAQNTPSAWIMNLGFLAFGLGVLIDALRCIRRIPLGALAFLAFGAAMMMTGIFSHRPIDPTMPFDQGEDALHSLFADVVGFAFVLGTVAFAFYERSALRRNLCALAAIIATAISIGISQLPDIAGMLQRLMFAVSFVWLSIFLPGASRPAPRARSPRDSDS